ncbi:MAG: hypothetical protein RL616_1431 [Verrucomicrobiota bacterium]
MNHCPNITSAGVFPPQKKMRADDSGSVMLEFVIGFPLVLVLMFACIQFSEIWIARMVAHYGAFCAARTSLVCKDGSNSDAPAKAAKQVCELLRQTWNAKSGDRNSTQIDTSSWNVTATHTYTLSLVTPIVGQIIAWGMNPWDEKSPWSSKFGKDIDDLGYPTIQLEEKVVLPKPYKTMVDAGF